MRASTDDGGERNSLILMGTTLVSRLLGIVKARVISSVFGAGALADSINYAYTIPNNLRKLFAEGALSQSYLPLMKNEDSDEEGLFISQLISFQVILFIPLIALTFIFSEKFILLSSGFSDPFQIRVSSSLLPYFLIFLFLISLSTVFSSALQVRKSFLITGAGPIFFTLTVIVSVICFSGQLSYYSMAIGTVAGAAAQLLSQYAVLRKHKLRLRFTIRFRTPIFTRMIRAFIPATVYSLILVADQYISFYLASGLETGAVTAVTNSVIFYQTPYGIFFSSIAGVYFPMLSSAADNEQRNGILTKALSNLVTFLLPGAIILLTLSEECISAVLQKGAFTYENTVLTSKVLKYYLVSMIPLSFSSMLSRFCYSRGNYGYPVIVSSINLIADVASMKLLIMRGFGAESISMALFISSCISVVMYALMMKSYNYGYLTGQILRIIGANIPLMIISFAYSRLDITYHMAGSTLKSFSLTAFTGLCFVAVTGISYSIFKIPFMEVFRKRKG
ncbi:MAG: murein biosynthesis integral membrane protein MurJ [Bullifex sp.]